MSAKVFEDRLRVGPVELAGIARMHRDANVCGDVFGWMATEESVTVFVVDGVGHGPAARAAAERAAECVLGAAETPLDQVLRRCHDALVGTRGAALSIGRIRFDTATFSFAGIGNVGLREHPRRGGRGAPMPGIVGFRTGTLRVFESRLTPGDLIVLHSDGVPASFTIADVASLPADELVRAVEARFGKPNDDATVVAMRFYGGRGV